MVAIETLQPGQSALTCGGDERFPQLALAGPGFAEREGDLAAALLRRQLAEPAEPDNLPDSGWHRVFATPTRVLFVAPGIPPVPWVQIGVGIVAGKWDVGEYGQCHLQVALPDGITAASFWLDPQAAAPTPESTTVKGLISERACANGEPPVGRVLEPIIVSGETTILVIVPVRSLENADCPGNPPFPYTLRLPAPLGSRVLLDASELPARDARKPPDM